MPTEDDFEERTKEYLTLPLSRLVFLAAKHRRKHKIRPCLFLPPSLLTSPDAAAAAVTATIPLIPELPSHSRVLLIIPSDDSVPLSLSVLFSALERIRENLLHSQLADLNMQLEIGLPSISWCLKRAENENRTLEDLLRDFMKQGQVSILTSIQEDRATQRRILQIGVTLKVRFDISIIDDGLHIVRGPDPIQPDNLHILRACYELFELESEFREFRLLYSIELYSDALLEPKTLETPFAAPLLRLLSLFRLLLPAQVPLFISPRIIGKNLALLFDDLGVISGLDGAISKETASTFNMPLLSEVASVKEYSSLSQLGVTQ